MELGLKGQRLEAIAEDFPEARYVDIVYRCLNRSGNPGSKASPHPCIPALPSPYLQVGISCAGGGQYFRKMDKDATNVPHGFNGWLNKERVYLLSVEDPKARRAGRVW